MTDKANFPCEMHAHTNYSDGNDTPYEFVENAAKRGLKVVVICDHDVIPPAEVVKPDGTKEEICHYAASKGITLFRGIEWSCETYVDDVHIVGLGCDWNNEAMIQEVANVSVSKGEAYAETIRRLDERGYHLTLEEVLDAGDHMIPLAELQKKRIFDKLAQKGYFKDWSEAKLFVRDDPYFSVKRKKPDALKAIKLIHDAGGFAIMAHPVLVDEEVPFEGKTISRWEFIDKLIEAGLDGIEIRYTYDKTTCKDKRPKEEIWKDVDEHIRHRIFYSGGSDYHGDYKKGIKNPRELGECGLTWEEFEAVPQFRELYKEVNESVKD